MNLFEKQGKISLYRLNIVRVIKRSQNWKFSVVFFCFFQVRHAGRKTLRCDGNIIISIKEKATATFYEQK